MTQTIPLIYCIQHERKLYAGPVTVSGGRYSVCDETPVSSIDALRHKAERGKVIVADAEGLGRRRFNAQFVEYCKVSGNELWLLEPIYDDADVLDGFIGNADKIVFPYTDIRNDSVLPDILEVSDNCVPLVTCANKACRGKDPVKLVRMLSETGFHNIMVADMDGSLSDEDWTGLQDECGGLIAYSPRRNIGTEMHILAQDVFSFSS